MKVQLFVPCFIDQLAPNVGVATYQLLCKLGCDVIYPQKQTCCGQAGVNAGCGDLGLDVLDYFYTQFSSRYPVVAPSASCISFIHQHQALKKRQRLSLPQCYELSYFINKILKINLSPADFGEFPHEVVFMKTCSALRDQPSVVPEALHLLRLVKGLNLIEDITASEECCGYGGSFSLKFGAISEAMGRRKLDNCLNTPATYITSSDMSCLLHLDRLIKTDRSPINIIHIAEILNETYSGK